MDPRLEALDYSAAEYRELFPGTPLEHLCAYYLQKIDDELDPSSGPGNNAWTLMWTHFGEDARTRLEGQSRGLAVGVELGLRMAAAVLKEPFGDPLPAIRAALELAVKQYQWYDVQSGL